MVAEEYGLGQRAIGTEELNMALSGIRAHGIASALR